jgi:hypothetical protein
MNTNSTGCFVAIDLKFVKNLGSLTSALTEIKLEMLFWPVSHLCLMRFQVRQICLVYGQAVLHMIQRTASSTISSPSKCNGKPTPRS